MTAWSVAAGISVLVAFCVYYNSLPAGFVYDDSRAILSNQDILPSTPLEALFHNDFWGTPIKSPSSHGSYRPLSVLTFRFNYAWSGFRPFAYHLTNIGLHCLCTALVHLLALSVLPTHRAAWVASALFGVHPVHTEAVAGLVGRADILSCIFYLVAILMFVHLPPRSILRYLSVTVLGACAMLSKEIGVSAVLICLVWDIVSLTRGSNVPKARRSWRSSILLVLSFVMLLCTRIMIMGNSTPSFSKADNPTAQHPSFVTRTLTFLYLPILNTKLLVFPQQLSYDWGMQSIPQIEDIYDLRNLATILFYSILIYIGIRLTRFLVQKHRRQAKRPLPSRINKPCDNLVIMCNYCRYRRRDEEATHNQKQTKNQNHSEPNQSKERDLNNNEIGKEILNLNYYHLEGGKAFNKANLDGLASWDGKSFRYETVVELYIRKMCLALTNMCLHRNYENTVFKSRKSDVMNTLRDKHYSQEDTSCPPNESYRQVLDKHAKNRTDHIGKSFSEVDARPDGKKVQKPSRENSASRNHCTCRVTAPKTRLKHEERLAIILALLIIPFIPASNLFFYVGFVLAERVLYIPSVGYCYLVAYAYSLVWDRSKGQRRLLNALVMYLMVIYAVRTVRRNTDWLNEENLYRSGIAVNPPKSYGNLGSILSSQRRYQEAEQAYRMALHYRSNMADVHYNL
ncbi:hypothetical protein M8J76_001778 [Diaphorina citri]|nr:hypothetical protein M8J76_001778 [Diaphorina citri]